ncbi:MAG TPA: CDP-diacylglycerol--serine O-phosphatidyltransferase [Gemmatales bacterium]|nr:CDP-diacylglycerol--serine O-phosphatidyltransferase [Gemmatales bacterium]
MTKEKQTRRRVAILPTLCTLANAVCGLSAIVCAAYVGLAKEHFTPQLASYVSGVLILLAMVFDLLDGYLARRAKSATQFGAELDSLCDAISFGAAPAFLVIQLGQPVELRMAKDFFMVTAVLYVCCTVLRLARFNVNTGTDEKHHRSFQGLPSPAAAGCLASLVLLRHSFYENRWLPEDVVNNVVSTIAPIAAIVLGLLMVSRIPYVHLGNRLLRRRQRFSRLIQLVLLLAVAYLFRELAVVLAFWGFALAGPVQVVIQRWWPSTDTTQVEETSTSAATPNHAPAPASTPALESSTES